jgi:anaerobic magnesium-protoporphyrin IX monomethyl ester cyclase
MPDNLPICSEYRGAIARQRDLSRMVVLIGFKRQGNLGLGYLASTLRTCGYTVEILDFEDPFEEILAAVQRADPVLVGFSLIFQFYIFRFESLMRQLREKGCSAHFTIGGHFPSLSHEHTLKLAPQLDSVVRFEGELTLLELVDCLTTGKDWHSIQGIAYRVGEAVVATPLRSLIHDLDELPYPDRSIQPHQVLGRPVMQMLASRGCARTCSFCSIHMFYRSAPGKVVRTRKPVEIAREMKVLHEERGISLFLFQDDDFPVFGPVWHRWTREFLSELYRLDLPGHILWKINARADAVDPVLFAEMRDAGMYLVYMGLESGSEEGLITLHKNLTVEQNIRAVDTLKELGILFDFGFMLLDPSSTFDSILENVAFLRRIVGDGYMAAEFCRMIPYDGTPIKDQLAKQGRLRGDVCNPDYEFLDSRIYDFYVAVNELLNITGWIHGLKALSPQLKYVWSEFAVIERLYPSVPDLQTYKNTLRRITKASNEVLFDVVEDLVYAFLEERRAKFTRRELRDKCSVFVSSLIDARNTYIQKNRIHFLRELGIEEPQAVA